MMKKKLFFVDVKRRLSNRALITSDNDLLRRIIQRSNARVENQTSNIEYVLQHHRQMHDELTTDLSRMAQQLKANSQSFGDMLAKDNKVKDKVLLGRPSTIAKCFSSIDIARRPRSSCQ